MRAALALYALRFGGWLLAKVNSGAVVLTVDLYPRDSASADDFGDITTLTRSYSK